MTRPSTTGVGDPGTVLIMSMSDTSMDARIQRQVAFLAAEHQVVLAAPGSEPHAGQHAFVELASQTIEPSSRARASSVGRVGLRLLGRYERAYWLDPRMRLWREQLETVPGVRAVLVNDLWALPLADAICAGAPIVFDAHEHWTSESASWSRRQRASMRGAVDWIVDRHVPRAAAIMTVSQGIADDYERRTGRRPELVTNAPFFMPLEPSAVSEPIRLLHFGYADERRRLEDTIDAVRSLGDRFTLDLVLLRDNDYRRRLQSMVANDSRVRVLPGVPTADLLSFANAYDVGVFLLPANFPNQVHVLPNKLFEYIQARLAVAIGPSPEMAAIVQAWDCGVVSESFTSESFAEALAHMTVHEVLRMKENSDRAAQTLKAESNRDTVLNLVRRAIGGR